MSGRTLVTGFLPFGRHAANPSALLAESSGRPFEVLDVSYAAVDAFVDRLHRSQGSFDRLLMLGLRGGGSSIELERVARNLVGPEPDVRGEIRGPAPVDPAGPDFIIATLFDTVPAPAAASDDAGCYLCNYLLYRALRRLPDKRVGFVHVPPTEAVPLDTLRHSLAALIRAAERVESRPPAAAH